jgi:tetratricopeptide (TPR) repeat protein
MRLVKFIVIVVLVLFPVSAVAQTVADYFNQGLAYDRAKDWDNAIIAYTNAIRLDPNLEQAVHNRGRAYLEKRSYSLAIADLNRAVQLAPNESAAFLDRAIAIFGSIDWDPWENDFDAAYSDVLKAIRLDPNNKYAYYSKAYAEYNDELDAQAKTTLDTLRRLDPNFPGAADLLTKINKAIADAAARSASNAVADDVQRLITSGKTAFDAKKYEEAIGLYTQALAKQPQNTSALFERGRAYLTSGKYDLSIADYNAAIKLNTKDAAAYNNRGMAYYYKGDHNAAIADYTQAITRSPDWVADIYVRRGRAFQGKEDLLSAIADYNQAIKLKPDSVFAYENRSSAYRDRKEYDLALGDATKVITLKPTETSGYYTRIGIHKAKKDAAAVEADYLQVIKLNEKDGKHSRGHYFYDEGRLDEAIADFAECIRLDPANAGYLDDRRMSYLKKKSYELALKDADAALKLQSTSHYYADRGEVFLGMLRLDEALADYEQAVKLDLNSVSAYIGRANVYREKALNDLALSDYQTAISKDARSSAAYYNRALAYLKMKKPAEAKADLEKAVEIDPNYTDARSELDKLTQPKPKPATRARNRPRL